MRICVCAGSHHEPWGSECHLGSGSCKILFQGRDSLLRSLFSLGSAGQLFLSLPAGLLHSTQKKFVDDGTCQQCLPWKSGANRCPKNWILLSCVQTGSLSLTWTLCRRSTRRHTAQLPQVTSGSVQRTVPCSACRPHLLDKARHCPQRSLCCNPTFTSSDRQGVLQGSSPRTSCIPAWPACEPPLPWLPSPLQPAGPWHAPQRPPIGAV